MSPFDYIFNGFLLCLVSAWQAFQPGSSLLLSGGAFACGVGCIGYGFF